MAKRHGITRLELRTLEERVDLPNLFREQYGTAKNLHVYLKSQGVSVVALDTSLKLVGNSPEDRTTFLEFIEWAEGLGCPYLRVFDGGSFAPMLSEDNLSEALETINWWRGLRKDNGWKCDIMVESHDCLTASSAIQQLQSHLTEPLPILWDTHHTWKKGGEDPKDTWAEIKEYVPHVHVKDSISEPSARHPFSYVMLGEGEFDLRETVSMLAENDFEGIVSIEWERKWHPYLAPLDEALQKAHWLGWW